VLVVLCVLLATVVNAQEAAAAPALTTKVAGTVKSQMHRLLGRLHAASQEKAALRARVALKEEAAATEGAKEDFSLSSDFSIGEIGSDMSSAATELIYELEAALIGVLEDSNALLLTMCGNYFDTEYASQKTMAYKYGMGAKYESTKTTYCEEEIDTYLDDLKDALSFSSSSSSDSSDSDSSDDASDDNKTAKNKFVKLSKFANVLQEKFHSKSPMFAALPEGATEVMPTPFAKVTETGAITQAERRSPLRTMRIAMTAIGKTRKFLNQPLKLDE